jgi:Asp-tRNA(Asn)/Glu-tRNA(Gln) amidotransferase A subunit family amidase
LGRCFGSATAASEMLRSGQVSSREVTELALIRIDALIPSLYAVVELSREAAQQ